MKHPSFLISVLFFLTVSIFGQTDKHITRNISLNNNTGTVTFNVTSDFDTLYSWNGYLNADCVGEKLHRLQPSKYSASLKHEPFSLPIDSLYQLTISHIYDCGSNMIFQPDSALQRVQYYYTAMNGHNKQKFEVFEVKNINGLDFVIVATNDTSSKGVTKQHLFATVQFKNSIISFDFVKYPSNPGNVKFLWESYEILKTIKIE